MHGGGRGSRSQCRVILPVCVGRQCIILVATRLVLISRPVPACVPIMPIRAQMGNFETWRSETGRAAAGLERRKLGPDGPGAWDSFTHTVVLYRYPWVSIPWNTTHGGHGQLVSMHKSCSFLLFFEFHIPVACSSTLVYFNTRTGTGTRVLVPVPQYGIACYTCMPY